MESVERIRFEGDKRTLCPICHCIMMDPVMDNEGHNMCRRCVDDLVKEQEGIVGMRSEFSDDDFEREDFNCPISNRLMKREDFHDNNELSEILETYKNRLIEMEKRSDVGRMIQ